MILRALIVSFILASSQSLLAKDLTLTWEVRGCVYKGTYDPKVSDEKKLKNTIDLLNPKKSKGESAFGFELEEMDKINIGNYEKYCKDEIKRLRELDIVNEPSIKSIRDALVNHKEKECRLDIIVNQGFKDSQKLKDIPTNSTCKRFSDALDGETPVKKVWNEMIQKRCKNDSVSEEGCTNQELMIQNKPRALDRIRLYVLTRGWFYCAVDGYLPLYPLNNTDEVQGKLAKAFKSVTKICPDDEFY